MSIVHGPNLVRDGLIFYVDAANDKSYPETGTTWFDLSGNNYDGTIAGSPTFSSSNLGIFEFDGTNDYINFGDITTLDNLQDFSCEVWFKKSDDSNTTSDWLVAHGAGGEGSSNQGFSFFGNLTEINWSTNKGGVRKTVDTSTDVDKWYHVVGTLEDGVTNGQKIYLNGELKDSITPASGDVSNTFGLTIGGYTPINTERWYGNIALVKIYNKALTEEEIQQNYNALRGRFGL